MPLFTNYAYIQLEYIMSTNLKTHANNTVLSADEQKHSTL